MADDFLKGKNIEFVAKEIAEGYVFVNPIYLKKFSPEIMKKLLAACNKIAVLIRNEKYPTGDPEGIKRRSVKLSRLNNAITVMKHFAKQRRWVL